MESTLMRDIEALEKVALKVKADRDALLDAAFEALELIEGYVDVVDGPYGQPAANKAMRAQMILQDAVDQARR